MCHCAALRGKDGMMTDRYVLDKSVRTNDAVRASYNELTAKTFGFTFEEWYRQGFWTDKNVPYALRDGTKVISNVSVNPMDILWNGEMRRYVQLGTVMTDPEYRGRGLARILISEILKDWRDRCDAMFLFANDSVLDFYPRFGFIRESTYQFRRPVIPNPGGMRRLNMECGADRELLRSCYLKSNPFSQLTVVNNFELLMFYSISFMKNCIFYLKKFDAVIIAEYEDTVMACYDIFCDPHQELDAILSASAKEDTAFADLGFSPVSVGTCVPTEEKGDTLFLLKGKENIWKGRQLTFPHLFHT